jgi:hypothetical protein
LAFRWRYRSRRSEEARQRLMDLNGRVVLGIVSVFYVVVFALKFLRVACRAFTSMEFGERPAFPRSWQTHGA